MGTPAQVRRLFGVGLALAFVGLTPSCGGKKAPAVPPAPTPAPAPQPPQVATSLQFTGFGQSSNESMALLNRGATAMPGDVAEFRAGPAPETFPKDLLPPGTLVSAAAVSPRMTVVVGDASDLLAALQGTTFLDLTLHIVRNKSPYGRGGIGGVSKR